MNEINALQHLVDATKRATTATVLTHNIDFMFAQAILVSRLRKSGTPRLTVFADAGCAAGSFKRQSEIANLVGRSFRVVPVDLGVGRRFHPKAIFLAGPDGARLAVGSGNLGHGGWSGNREIWTYFDYPGDGGPAIAAFRDYLGEVCELAGASGPVRATVLEPFRSEPWAANLPEPNGLLTLPADTPLMDQILAEFDGPPASFDVLAPYFDAEGVAVGKFADRLDVPMRVLIQHGKEGLSSSAAAKLPASARILGVTPGEQQRQTIHAKLYAALYADRVVLVAGSANCSRAALLSRENGNAELMAVSQLTIEEYEDLLSGIKISDGPPNLPQHAPNGDWDVLESPPVRVLSASFEEGVMTVRCAFAGAVAPPQIRVVLNMDTVVAVAGEAGTYSVEVYEPGYRLWVEIDNGAGLARSAPMWIDHEAELRIGRTEIDFQAKCSGNEGPISSDGLIDLFTLVVEHYNCPVPWTGKGSRKKAAPAVEYDLDEVFSDGFGRRSYAPVSGGSHFNTNEWTLMNDYFRVGGGTRHAKDPSNPPEDPPGPEKPPTSSKPLEPSQVQKLGRLIEKAVTSMSSMAFLESRPPARLAADIRTAALLLAIARRREGMDKAKIDAASARLFHTLFAGSNGNRPRFDVYIEGNPDAPNLMQSSDLTAVMTLWIADLLNKPEAGSWFGFAATRLAALHPWLTQGKEDRLESLERLSVYVADLAEALPEFWVSWVRGGAAVKTLVDSLVDSSACQEAITRTRVYRGEIVWVGGQFGVAQADFARKAHAQFYLLRDARLAKFMGERAVPIIDIVDRIGLPKIIVDTVKRILAPAGLRQAAE